MKEINLYFKIISGTGFFLFVFFTKKITGIVFKSIKEITKPESLGSVALQSLLHCCIMVTLNVNSLFFLFINYVVLSHFLVYTEMWLD